MSPLKTWRKRLASRKRLLAAAKKAQSKASAALQKAKRVTARRTRLVAEARRGVKRHTPKLGTVVGFDGAPVPRGLALALGDARRHGWRGSVVSCDRREGVAERFGKSSQAALYRGWLRRLPGYNPANPPGFSTHERRHDGSASLSRLGKAYRTSRGAALAWWQTGIDVSDAPQLVAVLNRLGYSATRPYSDPREAHHVNFRVDPTATLKRRGLR